MGHYTLVIVHCSCFGFRPSPIPLPEKGTEQSPSFWPMSIVAKRSPTSANAELSLNFWTQSYLEWVKLWT